MAFNITVFSIARVAGDERIGMIKEFLSIIHFHTPRIESTGRGVAKRIVNQFEKIVGDSIMMISASSHCIDKSAPLLVSNGAVALDGEIVRSAETVGNGNHGLDLRIRGAVKQLYWATRMDRWVFSQ